MTLRPFTIAVPDEALADLRRRLAATRWISPLTQDGWDDGTSLSFLRRLAQHWAGPFDWRTHETRLNRLPQFMAEVDGMRLHLVHQPGRGPAPLPLVVTHGWPGSFVELERLVPLLADPGAHGADPADAFHVVVPSLPGYGFSPAPGRPGVNAREIAHMWHGLMGMLGYDRFSAQGGDIGAGVSQWLAREFPDAVVGAHVNYVSAGYRPPTGPGTPPQTGEERAYQDRVAAWTAEEGGYAHQHATRPQTLAHALADSPVGLASWIVEKVRAWSDHEGDVERVFTLDDLLTNISVHWFSGTPDAALRLYKENRFHPLAFEPGERVRPPLGVALFPRELPLPPRSWLERVFDVRRWTPMPRGGHFAALEEPDLLAADIRAFFRPLRSRDIEGGKAAEETPARA